MAGISLVTGEAYGPAREVQRWARVHGVPLVEIRVPGGDAQALASVRDAEPLPVRTELCTRPTCRRCGERRVARQLLRAEVPCPQCPARILLVSVRDGPGVALRGPEAFRRDEADLARELGALLVLQQPFGAAAATLSATCRTCGRYLGPGEWPKHREELEAGEGVSLGLSCPRCAAVSSDTGPGGSRPVRR